MSADVNAVLFTMSFLWVHTLLLLVPCPSCKAQLPSVLASVQHRAEELAGALATLGPTSAQLQNTEAQLSKEEKDSLLRLKLLGGVMRQLEAEQAGHEATRAALPQEHRAHPACKQALAEVAAELKGCEAELDAEQRAHSSTLAGLDEVESQHARTRDSLHSLLKALLRQLEAEQCA
jgi:chromosome segregation ATPase